MLRIIYFIISIFLFSEFSSNAQDFEIGILGGTNLNFVSLNEKNILDKEIRVTPRLSYNFGASLKIKDDRKFVFLSIEYVRLINRDRPDFICVDPFGNPIKTFKQYIVIHNLKVSALGFLKVYEDFIAGIGITGNINIKSNLKLDDEIQSFDDINYGKKFSASHFRKVVISIPISIGYEFNKCDILLTFDKGIMNRQIGTDSYIKEINNVLSLSLNYRFIGI
jgi:hypothetical protein